MARWYRELKWQNAYVESGTSFCLMRLTIGQYASYRSQCRFCNCSLNFERYILRISCKNKQNALSYGYSKLKPSLLLFLQLLLLYEFACKLPIQRLESAWQKPLFVRNVCFTLGFILHMNKTYPARFIYLAGFYTLYTIKKFEIPKFPN